MDVEHREGVERVKTGEKQQEVKTDEKVTETPMHEGSKKTATERNEVLFRSDCLVSRPQQ